MAKKKKNIDYENLKMFKENLDKDITKHVTLTQAEYNALTTEERNNGTIYFISDGVANISDADMEYIDTQDTKTLNLAKTFTTEAVKNFYTKTEADALLNSKADNDEATAEKAGILSVTDKVKLDGIENEANKYIHPTTSGNKHIPSGGGIGKILKWSADGTAEWGNSFFTLIEKKRLSFSPTSTQVNVINMSNTGGIYLLFLNEQYSSMNSVKIVIITGPMSTDGNGGATIYPVVDNTTTVTVKKIEIDTSAFPAWSIKITMNVTGFPGNCQAYLYRLNLG